jgi:hypothetical protein
MPYDGPQARQPMDKTPSAQERKGNHQKPTPPVAADHLALTIFLAALLAVFAVVILAMGLAAAGDAAVSAYTQAHGVRENAVVDSDSMTCANYEFTQQCGARSSLYPQLAVTLSRPVGGQNTSSVDLNGKDPRLPKGDVISVLVDPQDPSHAELPGKPFNTAAGSDGMKAASAAMFGLAMAIVLVALWRRRRHRRA